MAAPMVNRLVFVKFQNKEERIFQRIEKVTKSPPLPIQYCWSYQGTARLTVPGHTWSGKTIQNYDIRKMTSDKLMCVEA